MKILFLSDNFPPEVNAPATRTYEHCKEWVAKGVEVTVVTCVPNFPKGKVFEGYKNRLYSKEYIDGIKVIRVWSYISANSGFIKRIIDFISFAVMSFIISIFIKTDIIVGTSPQFFVAMSARCLKFFKRKPWVMEVRDLWPESIAAVGALKKESTIYKFLHRIEKGLYHSANLIIVVTDSFKKYIIELGIDDRKIKVVKNGVDSSKFGPIPKDQHLIHELHLNSKFVIGYIGTHGMAHGLNFILECAALIKDPQIHFIFLGDGAEKKNLLKQAKALKLNNISFLPFAGKDEIKEYISVLDVSLVNLKKSNTFKSVIPSKIFENACMEKPILLGVDGESKEMIENYNAGICYSPENKTEFLKAIENIRIADKYKEYKQGCRNLSIDFERKNLALKMLNHLENIIKINE